MCTYSMIVDHYTDKWGQYPRPVEPWRMPPPPASPPPTVSPAELEEFRQLLERAREYDKKNNQPECELQEKKDRLLKLAKELGVEINFL